MEPGDQIAVILSLISSKTTVMQFGMTDDPWEWGTDLTASNSSHLSVSSSNNLKADRSTSQACSSGHLDCHNSVSENGDNSFLQIASIVMRWSFLSLSVHFWLIWLPMQQSVVKGMRPFYPEKYLQVMFLFHSKKLFKGFSFFFSFFLDFSTILSGSITSLTEVSELVWGLYTLVLGLSHLEGTSNTA